MRIVLKEHETKTLKALKLMQEVRDELLKREYEDGLKAPFGNVFRFKLDSTLEKFDFLLTPSKQEKTQWKNKENTRFLQLENYKPC